MKIYIVAVLLLATSVCCFTQGEYLRVCYFSGWARFREGIAKYQTKDINTQLCSHLIFAFAKLDKSATNLSAFDYGDDPGLYKKFTDLKKDNPKLKTMLSVGGWNMASFPFHKLVSTNGNIKAFARNAVTFLRTHNFDGLDLDWEFPADRGSPASDKHRFTLLIKALRRAFNQDAQKTDRSPLILSAALGPTSDRVAKSYEVKPLANALDFISLMVYDLHGYWDGSGQAFHHSPLYGNSPNDKNNVHSLVTYWLHKGVPAKKLVLGVPLYGRTFQLSDSSRTTPGTKVIGPGAPGPFLQNKGMLAYNEICTLINEGASVHHLNIQKVPYMVDGNRWTGYDDEESVQEKAQYIVDHHLGGAMVWALDLDDFHGNCGSKYPLLTSLNKVLALAGPIVG